MKNCEFNGQMLPLIGCNGCMCNTIVAAALVLMEIGGDFRWFFQQVKHGKGMADLLDNPSMLFVSDQHHGLLNAIDGKFPTTKCRHCLVHLARSLEVQPGGVCSLGVGMPIFWKTARSTD